jgi:glutathione synthase/RimK-type ligase-like ATP-grasp enzyme
MIYLWNSSATSVTGPKIKEELCNRIGDENAVTLTREKPETNRGDTVICYGAKTNENVVFPRGVTVINHPNNIRINRNKFKALEKLDNNEDLTVPKFCKIRGTSNANIKRMLEKTGMVVARTKYHQMGRGLSICTTTEDVLRARDNDAFYIQVFIPTKKEYRLNVNFGKVDVASVKTVVDEPEAAWLSAYKERVLKVVEDNPNEALIDKVLEIVVKDMNFPNFLVRSHNRGWTFKRANLNNVPNNLKTMAVKAVEKIGLDCGAVDCAVDLEGHPFIIEVNSGPALEGRTLTKFVDSVLLKIHHDEGANVVREDAVHVAVAEALVKNDDIPNEGRDEDMRGILNNLIRQQAELNNALVALAGKLD